MEMSNRSEYDVEDKGAALKVTYISLCWQCSSILAELTTATFLSAVVDVKKAKVVHSPINPAQRSGALSQ